MRPTCLRAPLPADLRPRPRPHTYIHIYIYIYIYMFFCFDPEGLFPTGIPTVFAPEVDRESSRDFEWTDL